MISVNDLKTGLTLELDNGLWSVEIGRAHV